MYFIYEKYVLYAMCGFGVLQTNDALVDRLLGTLSPSSLILKGKLFHMRCCAHIINLIVQDGFSMIEKAIKNVRDSVSFWTCSPKRAQDFKLVA